LTDETTTTTSTIGRRRLRPIVVSSHRRKWLELALFVVPALVFYLMFVLYPIVQAVHYSVFNWSGLGPITDFVGLGNYRDAFSDPDFTGAIKHNFILVGLSLLLQFPLALSVALLLDRPFRGRRLARLIFFAPYVLSEAITAVIWLLILQPDGLADRTFQSVGLGGAVQLWLADLNVVLFTLFVVISWKYIGFGIILFLAGLQGIPKELNEAAAIDGAGVFQKLRFITLPLLGPTIRIWGFLAIIGSLQLFDLVWIITQGGPAERSNTMATYMFSNGFVRYQFGYGCAVAVILFAISFLCALLYQRFVLRRDTAGALTRMA
jgi:raffinose/stachyose/melibiose transport system permease protein